MKKKGKRLEGRMFPLSITEKTLSTPGPVESAREPELHRAFLSFYRAFVVKTGRARSENKRRQQRRWEGWKRCRKRGDISLRSYGRGTACGSWKTICSTGRLQHLKCWPEDGDMCSDRGWGRVMDSCLLCCSAMQFHDGSRSIVLQDHGST